MEEFDVIVVGAGPAGLRASANLAKAGLKTICFDKNQEIGIPKRCGEGLGMGWFERLDLKPDPKWAVQEIRGIVLYAPSEKKIDLDFNKINGYVLERRVFEKELAKVASKNGAIIKTKADVFELKRADGKVEVKVNEGGDIQEYSSKLIFACDGVETLTARRLGVNTTMNMADYDAGYQYEMTGIDFKPVNMLHFFFGSDVAPRGYVWIFPKGKNHANVGIGIASLQEGSAKEYLDKFIASHPNLSKGSIIEVNCGCIPVGGFLDELAADNLLIAGDAAHQVNPIHGGGIGIAMEGADFASEVAIDSFKKNDFSGKFLNQYTKNWYKLRGNKLKAILTKRHMFENLTDSDFEILTEAVTGEDVLTLSHSDMIGAAKVVTKKLVKYPKLAKLMLKYLK